MSACKPLCVPRGQGFSQTHLEVSGLETAQQLLELWIARGRSEGPLERPVGIQRHVRVEGPQRKCFELGPGFQPLEDGLEEVTLERLEAGRSVVVDGEVMAQLQTERHPRRVNAVLEDESLETGVCDPVQIRN